MPASLRPAALLVALALAACGGNHEDEHPHDGEAGHHDEAGHAHDEAGHAHDEAGSESWSVTAWGERFEIFAEADPLAAGETSSVHTHVTFLDDFSALTGGTVTVLLTGGDGSPPQAFRRDRPVRPGIFDVEIAPGREGVYELAFRVEANGIAEEIPAGRVRIGSPGEPGGLVAEPGTAPAAGGEPVSFIKEQQWRTAFATDRVSPGAIHTSVRGPARVVPAAGGEQLLTAPADGVVQGGSWPYPGAALRRGAVVFRIAPQVAAEHSLAELEAAVTGLTARVEAARAQSRREEELLAAGVSSRREAEEARAELAVLEADLAAARRDLEAARAAREGVGRPNEALAVRSPFDGRVAAVRVSPGETVAAGAALARVVKSRPLWLQLALAPRDAAAVEDEPAGVVLRPEGAAEPLALGRGQVRLVSRSPEVDAGSGTVAVLLEVDRSVDELRLGSLLEAEVLLAGERRGIVIPATALVDDSGVPVVYLQTGGESFVRREVEVVARQGERLLVGGLSPGERLVTRGGAAIRRTALLATGSVDGHQH